MYGPFSPPKAHVVHSCDVCLLAPHLLRKLPKEKAAYQRVCVCNLEECVVTALSGQAGRDALLPISLLNTAEVPGRYIMKQTHCGI